MLYFIGYYLCVARECCSVYLKYKQEVIQVKRDESKTIFVLMKLLNLIRREIGLTIIRNNFYCNNVGPKLSRGHFKNNALYLIHDKI